jgi:hypothetical protein
MHFDDDFIAAIPATPIDSVIEIISRIQRYWGTSGGTGYTAADYEIAVEGYVLLGELAKSGIVTLGWRDIPLVGDKGAVCGSIAEHLELFRGQIEASRMRSQVQATQSRIQLALGQKLAHEFSQGDLDRLQALINEMRTHLSSQLADALSPDHRQRLLARLEALQRELHKRMSDLDKAWAFMGDFSTAVHKLGTDAKPMMDRFKEFMQIVWNSEARSAELPSDTPLPSLGHEGGVPSDDHPTT